MPNPLSFRGTDVEDADPGRQKWLAIKLDWKPHGISADEYRPNLDGEEQVLLEDTVRSLRSLSQTCQRLRAIALPRLWAVVHVESLQELGRLRETLRVSPHLAQFIRSFVFLWDMNGDYSKLQHYPQQEGSLLDLAFRDRTQMWTELRDRFNYEILEQRFCTLNSYSIQRYFRHDSKSFFEPGQPPLRGGTDSQADVDDENSYDWGAPRLPSSGPDGKGQDALIQNADQAQDALTEVIAQFSALQTFGWSSPVLTVPGGAFEALQNLTTITSLHVDASERGRGCFRNCESASCLLMHTLS